MIPREVRARHGWEQGTELIVVDTEAGVLVLSAEQGIAWLRSHMEGRDLVGELMAERCAEAGGALSRLEIG